MRQQRSAKRAIKVRGAAKVNRLEALHFLGLDEDATPEDIKTAYRESAQILHPDKFATNQKLQDRATEQFKTLQQAYELLMKDGGSRARRTKGQKKTSGERVESYIGHRRTIEARLAGIAAARAQLVAQRDTLNDERRNGLVMAIIGAVVALITVRRAFGILGLLFGIGSVMVVTGVVKVISAHNALSTLNEHIRSLNAEQKRLIQELEDLGA